jgi:hydrogenase nickel incorporation protein HypB
VADLDLDAIDLLIVENIGNLVCPAEFDIGEDKPAKYPLMFRQCDATLLNKIDLLPYLDFDMDLAKSSIAKIHPGMPVYEISAKTEAGFDGWIAWIEAAVDAKKKS